MKIENTSARLWTIEGIPLIPGKITTIPDSHAESIKGCEGLRVVPEAVAEDAEFKELPTTKAQLAAALKEKGIEFDPAANKADLQALYDAAE